MSESSNFGCDIPGLQWVRRVDGNSIADVHVALQRALQRTVAVKVFHAFDTTIAARLEGTLRTQARLAHPGIVGIQQIGRSPDGRLFCVTPYLANHEPTQASLRQKPLKVAALLRALLEALDYAHRHDVLHGGIQPANVLFDANGNPLLSDFGLARCAAEAGLPHPVAAAYISPEQARGHAPELRSDLYSVGVIAWELLTGAPPFAGADAIGTAMAHVQQPLPAVPAMLRPWQPWLERALAKSPDDRFQSAHEMANALGAIDGKAPTLVAGEPHLPRGARPRRRSWLIAGAVIIVAVAVAAWAFFSRTPQPNYAFVTAEPTSASTAPAPVIAVPASASSASSPSGRAALLAQQGDALRTGGHLFKPAGDNAAEDYLAALALDPTNAQATHGIDALVATLEPEVVAAWSAHAYDRTTLLVQQTDGLALHASAAARQGWATLRRQLAHNVGATLAAAIVGNDTRTQRALAPLAKRLPAIYPTGFNPTVAARKPAPLRAGSPLRDAGGPALVYVPATAGAPAFAIARVEVTRANYAAFVQATHRAPSECLEAFNPFSRLKHLTWQAPGFAQTGTHPVVCVSWDDAVAYTQWLSRTTGHAYRLPTNSEWLRAAAGVPQAEPCQLGDVDDVSRRSKLDNDRWKCNDGAAETAPVGHYLASGVGAYDMYGNVSEWLAGGSADSREFRGLSWRDGSHQTPLGRHGTARSDDGYTNVGFRVVRVIDAAQPAPRTSGD
ncbi:MAG TPA: bifunctional serine/threonine-protein kinase/formylglycine-generating enzyme family protein [Rhodanobacteraceae bacterium]